MIDKFLKTISKHQMISVGSSVGVGLSGGADSVALLHLLISNKAELGISNLKAIHIHHGIRGVEADRDLEFSKALCEKLGVEFLCFYANIPLEAKKTGESIEECARRIRYDYFSKLDCDKIATAHNLNDNIETVIFNLSRGSALSGLCGIPYVRDSYVRPLLDCSRTEIEAYIEENSLEYVVDSTNLCDDYTRNKIRHNIIPQLIEINQNFEQNFANCNSSIRVANDYILQCATNVFESAKDDDNEGYNCKVIDNCHKAIKSQVVLLILKEQGVPEISKKHIDAVLHIIKNGGMSSLGGGMTANSDRHFLRFKEIEDVNYFEIGIGVDEECLNTPIGKLKLGYLLKENLQKLDKSEMQHTVDCDKICGKLLIRNRCEGDYYQPLKRVNKKLKKLFTEENIPIQKRSRMMIVCDEQGIVWTEFFGVADRCKVEEKTKSGIKFAAWEE